MSVSRQPSVLVLTHFYPPEPCAAASRVASLVAALLRAGADVHVVTGCASFPSGRIAPTDRLLLPQTTRVGGVRVTRVPTFASPVQSGRHRLANWLSVASGIAVVAATLRHRRDVVVATFPPITLAPAAILAGARHRAKLVVDVRDVFPDVAIRMGYWKANGRAARLVGRIARLLYRSADLILCVTPSAVAEVRARAGSDRTIVLAPNGFDPSPATGPSSKPSPNGAFVVAFAGNMGLATGLDVVLDAALIVRGEGIRFVLAGDGADRARLAARVAAEGIENVTFAGVLTRGEANAFLAGAGAAVVPLHSGLVDSLPTKLFDAMAVGCPVVCAANGEARAFVERSGGGIAIDPGDAAALAGALRRLRVDATSRSALGDAGRQYVLEHYDRARIMDGVAGRIVALAGAERDPRPSFSHAGGVADA